MSEAPPQYGERIAAIEPLGTQTVPEGERHGRARDLFALWYSANAEIATWMVGVYVVALYGTDLRSAAIGIVIGNLAGYALLGWLSTRAPRDGVPQMLASQRAFGALGNRAPATLAFLAGVGWFAVNSVFGAYALSTLTHWSFSPSLATLVLAQVVLAAYGHNLIHAFQRIAVAMLTAGFVAIAVATLAMHPAAIGFHADAPLALGGAIAGFSFAIALSFSYATGWLPCAADYARYLPRETLRRSLFWYSFLGSALPCIAIEVLGALAATALGQRADAAQSPTDAIAALLGHGLVAGVALATIVLGTLTANSMNLYSGALAALVATRIAIPRFAAALVVGGIGAAIAFFGSDPRVAAEGYSNFLLLLSYWTAPWAAVVLFARERDDPQRATGLRVGTAAWLLGVLASLPFWNQAWYVGPVPRAFPALGDLSYEVGFVVAAAALFVLQRNFPKVPG